MANRRVVSDNGEPDICQTMNNEKQITDSIVGDIRNDYKKNNFYDWIDWIFLYWKCQSDTLWAIIGAVIDINIHRHGRILKLFRIF